MSKRVDRHALGIASSKRRPVREEVLRLHAEGYRDSSIATRVGVSRSRVGQILGGNPTSNRKSSGVVYFLESAGLIKIGYTKDITTRMQMLVSSSPTAMLLLGTVPGTRKVEQTWHRLFASCRHHNEWFTPSEDMRFAIAQALDSNKE